MARTSKLQYIRTCWINSETETKTKEFVQDQPAQQYSNLTEQHMELPDSVEKQAVSKGLPVKNAFLFLVDWRKPMLTRRLSVFEDSNVNKPMLSVVLRAIADIMKKQIISSPSDSYGVVAFGTSGVAEDGEWPRVRVIQPVERLNATAIKRLQKIASHAEMLGDISDDEQLEAELMKLQSDELRCFGDAAPVQFDKALWASRLKLQTFAVRAAASAQKTLHRLRVVVLTCDDDPTSGSTTAHQQAKTQANDIIGGLHATIDVMLLSDVAAAMEPTMNEDVDCKGFFDQVVHGGDDVRQEYQVRGKVIRSVLSRDEIVDRFQYRNRSKRAMCRTTFTLHEGYAFGIACYLLTSKKKRPTKVELFAETNEPVKRVTTSICAEIGKTLKPEDIRHTYNLTCLRPLKARGRGAHHAEPEGKEVPVFGFTKEELTEITTIGPRGITLYGFKPLSSFRPDLIMKNALFIHPDEKSYKGSRALFTQLLHSMLKKRVFAVVLTAVRKTSMPRFAAMIPQEEELDDHGRQVMAPGFFLHPLPYKDDIRLAWRNELEENVVVEQPKIKQEIRQVKQEDVVMNHSNLEPAGTDTARKIIRGLTIKKYHPRMFVNPDLAMFYRGLQTEAGVEDDGDEPIESEIHPKIEQIDSRQGAMLRKFKAETMGENFDAKAIAQMYGSTTGKRTIEKAANARAKKEAKTEAAAKAKSELDMDFYVDYYTRGYLSKLLKKDLTKYLDAHEILHKGFRKPDCVMEVEAHIKKYLKAKEVKKEEEAKEAKKEEAAKSKSRMHSFVDKTLDTYE